MSEGLGSGSLPARAYAAIDAICVQPPLPDCARAAKTEKGARCMTLTVPPTQRSNGNGFRSLGAGLPQTKEAGAALACKAKALDSESQALLAPGWVAG